MPQTINSRISVDRSTHLKRSDLIAEDLKRLILAHDLKPGDRLPQEKDLIQLFSSSRGTIRESLKSLEVQGLIDVVPGPKGGARVKAVPYGRAMQLLCNYLHFQDMTGNQIYDLRKVLEPMMALSVVGLLSEADFQALEETILVLRDHLADQADDLSCRAAELEFHNILARASRNPFLAFNCRFMNDLLLYYVVYRNYSSNIRRNQSACNMNYHIRIIEAYRQEDGPKVMALMTEHMDDMSHVVHELEAAIEQGLIPQDIEATQYKLSFDLEGRAKIWPGGPAGRGGAGNK